MPKNLYSEQDDEFLRANYLEMSNAVLAEHLGRTVRSVEKRLLSVLGLKRTQQDMVVFAGRRRTLATRRNVKSTVVKFQTNGLTYLPLVLQLRKQMTPSTSTARPATRAI